MNEFVYSHVDEMFCDGSMCDQPAPRAVCLLHKRCHKRIGTQLDFGREPIFERKLDGIGVGSHEFAYHAARLLFTVQFSGDALATEWVVSADRCRRVTVRRTRCGAGDHQAWSQEIAPFKSITDQADVWQRVGCRSDRGNAV